MIVSRSKAFNQYIKFVLLVCWEVLFIYLVWNLLLPRRPSNRMAILPTYFYYHLEFIACVGIFYLFRTLRRYIYVAILFCLNILYSLCLIIYWLNFSPPWTGGGRDLTLDGIMVFATPRTNYYLCIVFILLLIREIYFNDEVRRKLKY